jgi:hypothetical protein
MVPAERIACMPCIGIDLSQELFPLLPGVVIGPGDDGTAEKDEAKADKHFLYHGMHLPTIENYTP